MGVGGLSDHLVRHFRTLSTEDLRQRRCDNRRIDYVRNQTKFVRLRIVLRPGPEAAQKCIIVYVRQHHSAVPLAGVWSIDV